MSETRRPQQDGFALFAVLGFLMLFAAILLPFAVSSRVKLLTLSNKMEGERLTLASEALSAEVANAIAHGLPIGNIHYDGHARCHVGGLEVDIILQDQDIRIDLNFASEQWLQAGFEALGLMPQDAQSLAEAVRAYRSPHVSTTKNLDSRLLPEDGLKRRPFEHLAELHDFPIMRQFTLSNLQNIFTLETGNAAGRVEEVDEASRGALTSAKGSPAGKPRTTALLRQTVFLRSPTGQGGSSDIFEIDLVKKAAFLRRSDPYSLSFSDDRPKKRECATELGPTFTNMIVSSLQG